MPSPGFVPPPFALVIEVTTSEGLVWTAMATEKGGIPRELANAPVIASILIHEWQLHAANNAGVFTRAPEWRKIEVYPWKL